MTTLWKQKIYLNLRKIKGQLTNEDLNKLPIVKDGDADMETLYNS